MTVPTSLGDFVFYLDVFFTIVTFLVSLLSGIFLVDETLSISSHLFFLPLVLVFIASFLSYFGAYKGPHKITLAGYSWAITRAVIFTVGILLALLFFLHIEYVNRFVILIFALTEPMFLMIIRLFATRYFKNRVRSGEKKSQNYNRWHTGSRNGIAPYASTANGLGH